MREAFNISNQITIEQRVSARYGNFSGQLRKASDYVVANPIEVASRSLRTISEASGVSPATFSRLSRALGYDSFDAMKDASRSSIQHLQAQSFSQKAERLLEESKSGKSILERQTEACSQNIQKLASKTDEAKLQAATQTLIKAKRVLLFGALGSTGIAEYMSYLANYFAPNWQLIGRMGSSLGSSLSNLNGDDAILIVTKAPYVASAVKAASLAKEQNASVILICDHHQCPVLDQASISFIVPSESPQFFSSYAATIVLIETLIAMILASSGDVATASVRQVEANNHALGEYWRDHK